VPLVSPVGRRAARCIVVRLPSGRAGAGRAHPTLSAAETPAAALLLQRGRASGLKALPDHRYHVARAEVPGESRRARRRRGGPGRPELRVSTARIASDSPDPLRGRRQPDTGSSLDRGDVHHKRQQREPCAQARPVSSLECRTESGQHTQADVGDNRA